MRRRFSLSVIALGLSLALLASACSSSDSSRNATFGEAGESAAAAPQWLYAVDAADVTVIEDGSGFSVSLPASERVTAFTDRPNRQTDSMTLLEFAENWEVYGFDTDPPNAALLLETGSQTLTSVVEMTNPRIENGQVIFGLNTIDDSPVIAGRTHQDAVEPGNYEHAALFIDTVSTYKIASGNTHTFREVSGNGQKFWVCGENSGTSFSFSGSKPESLANNVCQTYLYVGQTGAQVKIEAIDGDVTVEYGPCRIRPIVGNTEPG